MGSIGSSQRYYGIVSVLSLSIIKVYLGLGLGISTYVRGERSKEIALLW